MANTGYETYLSQGGGSGRWKGERAEEENEEREKGGGGRGEEEGAKGKGASGRGKGEEEGGCWHLNENLSSTPVLTHGHITTTPNIYYGTIRDIETARQSEDLRRYLTAGKIEYDSISLSDMHVP